MIFVSIVGIAIFAAKITTNLELEGTVSPLFLY